MMMGILDFILAGNQSAARVRIGVIDANFGQLYEGDGKGHFKYIPQIQSGFKFKGDVRSLKSLVVGGDTYILVGVNNLDIESYKLNKPR